MAATDNPAQSAAFRAALRQRTIAAREALAPALHAQHSAAIGQHLENLLAPHAPGILAFCWPIRGEFDCRPLLKRLLRAGWRACIPVVVAADRAMVFRGWTEQCPMAKDRHGIPIPAEGAECRPDVVLLPLVAFDADGYRLGYGGGYFDRTLATLAPRPWCIGVGFELGRVASIQPDAHDIPMDVLVTEAGSSVPSRGGNRT